VAGRGLLPVTVILGKNAIGEAQSRWCRFYSAIFSAFAAMPALPLPLQKRALALVVR
jgi:hypothetical protein